MGPDWSTLRWFSFASAKYKEVEDEEFRKFFRRNKGMSGRLNETYYDNNRKICFLDFIPNRCRKRKIPVIIKMPAGGRMIEDGKERINMPIPPEKYRKVYIVFDSQPKPDDTREILGIRYIASCWQELKHMRTMRKNQVMSAWFLNQAYILSSEIDKIETEEYARPK